MVLENLDEAGLEGMRNMLLAMDPPRHVDYRRPLVPSFKAKVIGAMEDSIRTICRGIIDGAREQGDVEFVHEVAAHLPTQVIGELVGLPREDWAAIQRGRSATPAGRTRDRAGRPDERYEYAVDANVNMAMYAIQLAGRAPGRARP